VIHLCNTCGCKDAESFDADFQKMINMDKRWVKCHPCNFTWHNSVRKECLLCGNEPINNDAEKLLNSEDEEYAHGFGDYYEEDEEKWEHWDVYSIRHRVVDAILKMPTDKAWEYIIWIDSQDGACDEEEYVEFQIALANKDLKAALQNLIIERGYISGGWGTGIINELRDNNYYNDAESFEAPYGRMPAWRRGKRQWNKNHLVWASDSKAVREAIKTAFPEQKFSVRIVNGEYIEVVAKSGTRPADIQQFKEDVKSVAMKALGEIYKDSPEELREKYVDVQAYERDFGAETKFDELSKSKRKEILNKIKKKESWMGWEAESFEGESPMMKNITAIGVLALAILAGKKLTR
jgi:hypothetical protein